MLLRIELAEHTGYWRFSDTVAFNSWIEKCPWSNDGGTCILRLPGRSDGHDFAEAVAQTVHGMDAGMSQPRVEIMRGDDVGSGVRAGMLQHFGVATDAEPWQASEALSRLFAERPTVIIVTPASTETRRDLWQEAEALRDEMSKSIFGPVLTWVLMDSACGRLDGRLKFDFTRGQPAFGIFDSKLPDERALWNAYVHARLAWEAAGDPSCAGRLRDFLWEHPRTFSDDDFERHLNEWARKEILDISEDHRAALEAFLSTRRDPGGRLHESGLVWRPTGFGALTPTPWAARGLLALDENRPNLWLLRGSLVCVTLAHDLLACCQEMEHQIKAGAMGQSGTYQCEPPAEAVRLWQRYRSGDDETTIYPEGHPAPPHRQEDAWLFASLGDFLYGDTSPLGRRCNSAEKSLLRLRNTLAHGHYVCWTHVQSMQRILTTFSSNSPI